MFSGKGGAGGGGGGITSLFVGAGGFGNNLLRSLGSSAGNVSSAGRFAPVMGAAIIGAIEGIVGAVIALLNVFAPLVNMILLLPAAIFTLVGAFAPLLFVFNGLGAAISAIASGDPEAIAEAMNKLGVNAQRVAKDIAALLPWLRDIGGLLQESFFGQFADFVPRLTAALGPTFVMGMERVAIAAGQFANSLITLLQTPAAQRFFEMMFASGATFWDKVGPGITKFIDGLMALSVATFPIIDKVSAFLGEKLADFGGWLTKITENGKLQEFMDELVEALKLLNALASSSWSLVKSIVGGAGEGDKATEFVKMLIQMIRDLDAFFKSDIGKFALQGMITAAEALLLVIMFVVAAFIEIAIAIQAITVAVNWLISRFEYLMSLFGQTINKYAHAEGTMISVEENERRKKQGAAKGLITGSRIDNLTIGENGPEAVIPLNDPARARELMLASGLMSPTYGNGSSNSNVTFGPGAVSVSFSGVVPTQGEAYRTGQAVGAGVADILAARNARLAVRTL